jgi:hypothetical protein
MPPSLGLPACGAQVAATFHAFLTRGVHSGGIVMTSCMIKHFGVPVVAPKDLWEFFASPQVRI